MTKMTMTLYNISDGSLEKILYFLIIACGFYVMYYVYFSHGNCTCIC